MQRTYRSRYFFKFKREYIIQFLDSLLNFSVNLLTILAVLTSTLKSKNLKYRMLSISIKANITKLVILKKKVISLLM